MVLWSKGLISGVFTTRNIQAGAVIFQMQGEIVSKPGKYSIQIDEGKHLSGKNEGEKESIDDDICHSCEANARIEYSDLTIRAKRSIKAGDEIILNYCASEEKFSYPFNCTCGLPSCYGYVRVFNTYQSHNS